MRRGRTVLLETSGEADIGSVDARVHRIMDLKAPGSGEHHWTRWSNLKHLTSRDEIKFVLADRADYEWMRRRFASGAWRGLGGASGGARCGGSCRWPSWGGVVV